MKNFALRTVVGAGVCAAVIAALMTYGADGQAGWWLALRLAILAGCLWELWRMKVRGRWWVAAFVVFSLTVPLHYIAKEWTAFVLLLYILIIWANDVGAYLVGSTLGRLWKSKLAPAISPNKTWAGAFGGLIFGLTLVMVAVPHMMGIKSLWHLPEDMFISMGATLKIGYVPFCIGLAVVAVVTGVIGDLLESLLKRRAGVKDSGHLLPGHGGMLDRFDSLIFSAPFVWLYFLIFA